MRISDWSSDVCSSDLPTLPIGGWLNTALGTSSWSGLTGLPLNSVSAKAWPSASATGVSWIRSVTSPIAQIDGTDERDHRSEEHTSELQSLMRISYAVFCLKKKKPNHDTDTQDTKTQNIYIRDLMQH